MIRVSLICSNSVHQQHKDSIKEQLQNTSYVDLTLTENLNSSLEQAKIQKPSIGIISIESKNDLNRNIEALKKYETELKSHEIRLIVLTSLTELKNSTDFVNQLEALNCFDILFYPFPEKIFQHKLHLQIQALHAHKQEIEKQSEESLVTIIKNQTSSTSGDVISVKKQKEKKSLLKIGVLFSEILLKEKGEQKPVLESFTEVIEDFFPNIKFTFYKINGSDYKTIQYFAGNKSQSFDQKILENNQNLNSEPILFLEPKNHTFISIITSKRSSQENLMLLGNLNEGNTDLKQFKKEIQFLVKLLSSIA